MSRPYLPTRRETSQGWIKSNKGFEVGTGGSGSPGSMQMTPTGLTFPDATVQTTATLSSAAQVGPFVLTAIGSTAGVDASLFFGGDGSVTGGGIQTLPNVVPMLNAGLLMGVSASLVLVDAQPITCTVYVNGVAKACVVVIAAGQTGGQTALSAPIALAAGDKVTVKYSRPAGAATSGQGLAAFAWVKN